MRPRDRAAPVCVPLPTGSPRARRHSAPPGGREWPPRWRSTNRPGRPPAPPSRSRRARRSHGSSRSRRPEWRATLPRPAAGTPCRARRAAGRGRARALRRHPPPVPPPLRTPDPRPRAPRSGSGLRGRAPGRPGRHRAGSRTPPCRWRRRAPSRVSTHRPRTGSSRPRPRYGSVPAPSPGCPAPPRRTGHWN